MDIEVAKMFAAALALLPLFFVALAMGRVFSSWIESVSRNPSAGKTVFTIGIIGAGLIEAVALYCLLISFMILI